MNALLDALGASSYAAHSICLTNDRLMIWLYAVHNGMIFASYMVLAAVTFLSRGAVSGASYVAFAVFIASCGLTHLTSVAVLYLGVYRLDVAIVVATAWISATTAAYSTAGFIKWRSTQRLLSA